MRSHYRRAAAFLAAVSLICFGACERHQPSELHHGSHAAADATEHTANVVPTAEQHDHPAGEAHAHPPTTPAEFFPSATPSPTP